MSLFDPVMCNIHIIIRFVMYNYVQITVHISICFCYAQLCTSDYA